jgi:hypothetical protein
VDGTDDAGDLDAILQRSPSRVAPPVDTRAQSLPVYDLTWDDTELLFLKLLAAIPGVEWAKRYGTPGQRQQGIDAYARLRPGSTSGDTGGRHYIALQSRRVKALEPSSIAEAVNDFLEGEWADRVSAFYFATSVDLRDRKLDAEIRKQAELLAKKGITFAPWGAEEVSGLLKAHPRIVRDFFGPHWAERFCGKEERTGAHGSGLPAGTPQFTGREEQEAKLAEQIGAHGRAGPVAAIYVIDGMPGVGKTELVLRVAHRHKRLYPDGEYYLKLHGYTKGTKPMSPETALAMLLRQRGEPDARIPDGLDARQERWQELMAGQRALVVLDNARDGDQVMPLLEVLPPGCLVLITSRTRLIGLPRAELLTLGVLAPGDAIKLLGQRAGRGRLLDPAAAELVRLAGYLPLAIVILADVLRSDPEMTVAELAAELTRTNARLDRTDRPGASVRAAFETSIERLEGEDQRAFAFLGLPPGTVIGVPQFAGLAGLSLRDARTKLQLLADRSLIIPHRDRAGHCRYELHDLLREFAGEQAESCLSEEVPGALGRLCAWYVAALSAIVPERKPVAAAAIGLDLDSATEGSAWIHAEYDNISALAAVTTGREAADMCMAYAHAVPAHYMAGRFSLLAMQKYQAIGDEAMAGHAWERVKSAYAATY